MNGNLAMLLARIVIKKVIMQQIIWNLQNQKSGYSLNNLYIGDYYLGDLIFALYFLYLIHNLISEKCGLRKNSNIN